MMNENSVMHSLVVCDFPGKFIPLSTADWSDYLNAVTGQSFSEPDLIDGAEIAETLIRRINIREGLTIQDDDLPRRILEQAQPKGPAEGKIIGSENFLKMRSEYYALRGWDVDGIPKLETLAKFKFDEEPLISI
jgi:aldehyde:ferredoxin oxidoreductase